MFLEWRLKFTTVVDEDSLKFYSGESFTVFHFLHNQQQIAADFFLRFNRNFEHFYAP